MVLPPTRRTLKTPPQVPEDGDLDGQFGRRGERERRGRVGILAILGGTRLCLQDEAVAAFTPYFEFLTQMYLDESLAARLPP